MQGDLVTKIDLNASSTALQGTIAEARRETREGYHQLDGKIRGSALRLEAKIEATKAELIKWMFGTVGFQTIIIIGAVIALTKSLRP